MRHANLVSAEVKTVVVLAQKALEALGLREKNVDKLRNEHATYGTYERCKRKGMYDFGE